jgi:beta-mannanase
VNFGPQPPAAGRSDEDWWPGDDVVDWVGVSDYAVGDLTAEVAAVGDVGLDWFYGQYSEGRGKPMMLAEWGVWDAENGGSGDNPGFVTGTLSWAATHPRVKAEVYFNYRAADANHRLEDFPRAATAYRTAMAEPRWVKSPLLTP